MFRVYQDPVKTTMCYGPCQIAAGQHLPAEYPSARRPTASSTQTYAPKVRPEPAWSAFLSLFAACIVLRLLALYIPRDFLYVPAGAVNMDTIWSTEVDGEYVV